MTEIIFILLFVAYVYCWHITNNLIKRIRLENPSILKKHANTRSPDNLVFMTGFIKTGLYEYADISEALKDKARKVDRHITLTHIATVVFVLIFAMLSTLTSF